MKNIILAFSLLAAGAAILYACNRNSPLDKAPGDGRAGLYSDTNTVKGLWVGIFMPWAAGRS